MLFSSKLVRLVHTVLFNGYSVGDTGTVVTSCVVWNVDPVKVTLNEVIIPF